MPIQHISFNLTNITPVVSFHYFLFFSYYYYTLPITATLLFSLSCVSLSPFTPTPIYNPLYLKSVMTHHHTNTFLFIPV